MKRLKFNRLLGVAIVLAGIASSGCLHRHINNSKGFLSGTVPFLAYFTVNNFDYEYLGFYPMPVSPVLSYEIEDAIDRSKKKGVPILGPIKGELAPIFCMDPPSEQEVYETLPPLPHGVPFVYEKQRKNVRMSIEKIVDQVDECRFYPLAGPCQLHHCHFKCTIWFEETQWMGYPIPWSYTEKKQEVVYIDKDHLHRCGEPGNLAPAGGPSTLSQY
jgi:hypothetical protein